MRLYVGKQDHNFKNRKLDNPILNALKRKLKRRVVYGIGIFFIFKRNNKTVERYILAGDCIRSAIDNYRIGQYYWLVGNHWLKTGNSRGI